MKLTSIFCVTILATTLVPFLRSEETEIELRPYLLEVPIEYGVHNKSDKTLHIIVELRNVSSRTIVVAKRMAEHQTIITPGRDAPPTVEIMYRISFERGVKNVRTIPSLSELLPVELNPGDIAMVRCAIDIPMESTVVGTKITYSVDTDIADRFHLWHGAVSGILDVQEGPGGVKGDAESESERKRHIK